MVVANVFTSTIGGVSQRPLLNGSPAFIGKVAESDLVAQDYALSPRNISPIPPMDGTTGSDAEEFEVTSYSATVETRQLEQDCAVISGL